MAYLEDCLGKSKRRGVHGVDGTTLAAVQPPILGDSHPLLYGGSPLRTATLLRAPESPGKDPESRSHRLHEEDDCGAQYNDQKPGIMAG